jgi:hypothetical protein
MVFGIEKRPYILESRKMGLYLLFASSKVIKFLSPSVTHFKSDNEYWSGINEIA